MPGDTRNSRGLIGCRPRRLGHSAKAHQNGLKVAVQKVLERRQEVDGGALDQLPAGAADLLLRLATLDQSVAWKQEAQPQGSLCAVTLRLELIFLLHIYSTP